MSYESNHFNCPKCGNKNLIASSHSENIDDLEGAICPVCSYVVRSSDILSKARHKVRSLLRSIKKRSYEE